MATRQEIEDAVQRIVEQRITSLDAAIPTFIKRAQVEIEDRCVFKVQHAETTINVTTASTSYSLPTDFIAVRGDPHFLLYTSLANEVNGESVSRVFPTETNDFTRLGNLYEEGSPKYWREDEGAIEFWPRGDSDGPGASNAYEVKVPYFKRLDELTLSTSTNWWTDNMDDALEYFAAASLLAEHRDPLANFWSARAEARFRRYLSTYKRGRLRRRRQHIEPTQVLSSNTRNNRTARREIISHIPS